MVLLRANGSLNAVSGLLQNEEENTFLLVPGSAVLVPPGRAHTHPPSGGPSSVGRAKQVSPDMTTRKAHGLRLNKGARLHS